MGRMYRYSFRLNLYSLRDDSGSLNREPSTQAVGLKANFTALTNSEGGFYSTYYLVVRNRLSAILYYSHMLACVFLPIILPLTFTFSVKSALTRDCRIYFTLN